jgi:hypothetical protein
MGILHKRLSTVKLLPMFQPFIKEVDEGGEAGKRLWKK